MTARAPVAVDVRLAGADLAAALRHDARVGLTADPKWLPPKWFYDDRGCALFDAITRLPEYYPSRREVEILRSRAAEVAAVCPARTLVELGSGTSVKTRLLLDALSAGGTLEQVVLLDVSQATLRAAAHDLSAAYPGIQVHAVVGDFEHHVDSLPGDGRRLVAFLGGTIGNLEPQARRVFLANLAARLGSGDALLLGTDLVKEPARLIAAYDDSAGITANFNLNVLRVLNAELGADFRLDAFSHVARWDGDREWIEMRLRSSSRQSVAISELGLVIGFAAGEELRTEISAKFRRRGLKEELTGAGLRMSHWWTDRAGDFALSLSRPEIGRTARQR